MTPQKAKLFPTKIEPKKWRQFFENENGGKKFFACLLCPPQNIVFPFPLILCLHCVLNPILFYVVKVLPLEKATKTTALALRIKRQMGESSSNLFNAFTCEH